MSAFISLLKVSNFVRSLPLPVFFALAWIGVIQGIEESDQFVFEGICLSAEA